MMLRAVIVVAACSCDAILAREPLATRDFLEAHCYECHDTGAKKGGLDLSAIRFAVEDGNSLNLWVKIHDRVRDGEMPPPNHENRPEPAAAKVFLDSIAAPMIAADDQRAAREGRAVWRRLNRYEYENAVRDLFNAPWLQIKDTLPEDGESHRFNKDGAALSVSHVQMASYLDAARYALREVEARQQKPPEKLVKRYYAREQPGLFRKIVLTPPRKRVGPREAIAILGTQSDLELYDGKAPMAAGQQHPERREEEAVGVVASTYEAFEPRFNEFKAPVGGRYKLRFSAISFWVGPNEEGGVWWHADRTKVSRGRTQEPVTIYADTPPRQMRWLGSFDVTPDPTIHELDVYLLAGETIRPDAARLFRSRPPDYRNSLATKDGMPGVAFRWMEAEGPLLDAWPSHGHQLLFGDLPIEDAPSPGADAEVISADPGTDARRLLSNFLSKSYRRRVADGEIDRFLAVFNKAQANGATFTGAMNAAYAAVLCSPGFVTVEESPGKLDDYALATRLSLFLWNTTPDATLGDMAASGELHDPQILVQQVERLLDDPRRHRFVDAFLDYWLDLRKLNVSAPDATLYPDYYLDDLLVESAQRETQAFFAELIARDLPSSNMVSSNFAMLNERLAQLYGIHGVTGVAIRRVELPPSSLRGGLMTQASVLKVTANGTTTSPVVRGAWIMERIVGKPAPPPPPNVPAIEPDIRGASTIRDQLQKHRTQQACSACHAKIDPAGFALESFDVMGGFREAYRASGEGKPVEGVGHDGNRFTFHYGRPVDASGELADGRRFKDVRELKTLLLADERDIARNLTRQLVIYSTGADVRFGDRPKIEAILDRAAEKQFGVRTLIHEIVASDLFQSK